MSKLVTWRALQPCMVGGVYREAGEVFEAPDGDYAPDVREKVGARNAAPEVTPDGGDKPLSKMNLEELKAKAASLGFDLPPEATTKKAIADYITARLGLLPADAPGPTPDDLRPDV